MIYNSTHTIEHLSTLVFNGCSIQSFLDEAEQILINPISFTPFKELNDSILSKSYPRENIPFTDDQMLERENYVMMRMSQLGEEPILTEGGPGIPRGHILCWAMEKEQSYGLVCVANTKIPLEQIDKSLVVYISRCLAHIYALQQMNKVKITPDEALERLIAGQISSHLQLSSSLPEYNTKSDSAYSLVVFRFAVGRTMQVGPYLRNQFKETFHECWCTWNGQYFTALFDRSMHNLGRAGKVADTLQRMGRYFQCPVCIGIPYENLLESRIHYERMISLPAFYAAETPELLYYEDYPECSLIFDSHLDASSLSRLTSSMYREMKEYDTQNHFSYVETLTVYLSCGRNVAKTAKQLFIHANSVLYRLNRMQELFGLDLENADAIFAFLFSVRLEQYC